MMWIGGGLEKGKTSCERASLMNEYYDLQELQKLRVKSRSHSDVLPSWSHPGTVTVST